MSQTALAERLGIDQTGVGQIERGERAIAIERLLLIEDVLNADRGAILLDAGVLPAAGSVEAAVLADQALTPEWRRAVLVLYRSAVRDAAAS